MFEKNKISIIGSGLVGSLLSVYLAKKGYQVNIFERRPDMRTNKISAGRSINLALSDRGWQGIAGAGLADEIKKIAIPMYGRSIHNADGTTNYQPYGKEGQAIYSVSRAGINMHLMSLAEQYENIKIHFNKRCTDVNLHTQTASFIDEQTQATSTIQSDVILGTDGAFSPIRLALQTKTDLFNYSQTYLEHGYKELVIPPNADGSFALEKNALHIWPRKSFMLIALPNIDGSFTCTLFLQLKGAIAFEKINTDEEISTFFKTYFPDTLQLMPTLLHDFKTNPVSSLHTVRCYPWSYKDIACLIGDAAHAIVPFFGQGMNCGFEDCVRFNELLEQENNWESVFTKFEIERKPNADAVAQLALDNFIEMRDLTGDANFLLKKKIEQKIAAQYPNDFLPMYTQVTFTPSIGYNSAFQAGKLHQVYLQKLSTIDQIFDKWDQSEVQSIIQELLQEIKKQSLN